MKDVVSNLEKYLSYTWATVLDSFSFSSEIIHGILNLLFFWRTRIIAVTSYYFQKTLILIKR